LSTSGSCPTNTNSPLKNGMKKLPAESSGGRYFQRN